MSSEADRAAPRGGLRAGAVRQLVLGTGAFVVCFAVFGSTSALMPILKRRLHLDPLQVSIALAIPVLLGSLGRIPLGMLADRYGGRRTFLAVLAASAVAVGAMGTVSSFAGLIVCGFFLGIALASFAVGVGFVSKWFPPERQGTALGVYGAGNVGQSLAAFGAPVIAGALGLRWGFWAFGVLAVAWLALFAAAARDAAPPSAARSLREVLRPLGDRRAWLLSVYYFLTFGGFVAMAIYLPIFLTDSFGLGAADAGFRTAGFVLLATAARPIGGMLADRVGGRKILYVVFPVVAVMAGLMSIGTMPAFTLGALGMAAAIGLGNGAVFKLVPEYFPNAVGGVTGLVGAAGGLGGFFPPLVLGAVRQASGSFAPGFALLAVFALLCLALLAVSDRGHTPTRAAHSIV
jgi:NNP family nitrate/nitrite transporter-like MFS transporter